jgi:hypothetical protein
MIPNTPGLGGSGGSAFVGATVVNGHSFPPVAASALDGSVFVTQTDLLMSTGGMPASPARHLPDGVDRLGSTSPAPFGAPPPHLRPMSPFEKAGIPLLRSSTPSLGSRHNGTKRAQGLPPRSSSSLSGSLNLPILSKSEDARYEPSLSWFESHYFYAKAGGSGSEPAASGKKGKKKSGSVTSGTFSLGDDAAGGGSSSAFFQQVLGTRKIASYVGEYAQSMHEIRQAYDGNACPPSLTKMCSSLIYKADERGMIGFADVVAFLVDLVPPPAAATFITTCKNFLQVVGGQTVVQGGSGSAVVPPSGASSLPPAVASAAWVHWRLPFPKLYNTFEAFFVTSLSPLIIRRCFDLCDVTHCGYILKDVFRQFRDEERMSSLAASVATSLPPAAPTAASITITNGVSSGAVVLPPPALSYLVVKGAWRVFEKIALEEEEKARNAGGKKGKKAKPKKGATGPVTVPGKRQFHISFKEFASAISEDPHIAIAFLPHAIETALANGDLPVMDPIRAPPVPME